MPAKEAVVSYLTAALADDARRLFDVERVITSTESVHVAIHRELARVGRRLQRERAGLPLHAAVVEVDGVGVLAPAPSNCGKTTFALALSLNLDGRFVTDDRAWIASGRAFGMGSPLAVRSSSPYWSEAQRLWHADSSERLLVTVSDLGARDPLDYAVPELVVLPSYHPADSWILNLPPASAFMALMSSLLRPPTMDEASELADLAARLPAARLTAQSPTQVARLTKKVIDDRVPLAGPAPSMCTAAELEIVGLASTVRGMRFGDSLVLWSSTTGRGVQIDHWNGQPLNETQVWAELTRCGLGAKR